MMTRSTFLKFAASAVVGVACMGNKECAGAPSSEPSKQCTYQCSCGLVFSGECADARARAIAHRDSATEGNHIVKRVK